MTEPEAAKIVCGDAFELINTLDSDSIDLTVTSPPYNLGKAYESRRSLDAYMEPYEPFIQTLYAKTATHGSVCWQVGNYIERGETYPLDILFYPLFKNAGFILRNRVIWHFRHGLHASRRLSGRYETVLWFSKSSEYKFDLDAIRVPAIYPGKRSFKGANRGRPTGNPRGKNPSDFWETLAEEWSSLIWDVPNVKANHPEKTVHPAQFPVELAERCVLALSRQGDLVFDPFLGSGSTAIAAVKHARRFAGFEYDTSYAKLAEERLRKLAEGSLRLRPLGKPIHKPSGSVARRPDEWDRE